MVFFLRRKLTFMSIFGKYTLIFCSVFLAACGITGLTTIIMLPHMFAVFAEKEAVPNVPETQKVLRLLKNLGETNVKVVFTDDIGINCGAQKSEAHQGGCFHPLTPDTIYLSTGLTDGLLTYLTYHEYAHVLQAREGQLLDECAADQQVYDWGFSLNYSGYEEECQISLKMKEKNPLAGKKFKLNV